MPLKTKYRGVSVANKGKLIIESTRRTILERLVEYSAALAERVSSVRSPLCKKKNTCSSPLFCSTFERLSETGAADRSIASQAAAFSCTEKGQTVLDFNYTILIQFLNFIILLIPFEPVSFLSPWLKALARRRAFMQARVS